VPRTRWESWQGLSPRGRTSRGRRRLARQVGHWAAFFDALLPWASWELRWVFAHDSPAPSLSGCFLRVHHLQIGHFRDIALRLDASTPRSPRASPFPNASQGSCCTSSARGAESRRSDKVYNKPWPVDTFDTSQINLRRHEAIPSSRRTTPAFRAVVKPQRRLNFQLDSNLCQHLDSAASGNAHRNGLRQSMPTSLGIPEQPRFMRDRHRVSPRIQGRQVSSVATPNESIRGNTGVLIFSPLNLKWR